MATGSRPAPPLGAHNPRITALRRLLGRRSAREEAGAIVLEGPVAVADALDAGVALDAVYADEAYHHPVLERPGVPVVRVAAGVLSRVGSTATPQPCLAVARWRPARPGALEGLGFVVVCAGLADPGNAGTVIRSAEAAGVQAVAFCDGAVDPTNPKVVRSSAGSVLRVPVVEGPFGEVAGVLRAGGAWLLGAAGGEGEAYDRCDLTGAVAIVVGNEAHGLAGPVRALLDGFVTVPMHGRAESLNAAMAATVLVFEAARQRRGMMQG